MSELFMLHIVLPQWTSNVDSHMIFILVNMITDIAIYFFPRRNCARSQGNTERDISVRQKFSARDP